MEQTKAIPDLVVVKHQEGKTFRTGRRPETASEARSLCSWSLNRKVLLFSPGVPKKWERILSAHR